MTWWYIWLFCFVLECLGKSPFPRNGRGIENRTREEVIIVVPGGSWSALEVAPGERVSVPNYLGKTINKPACDAKCEFRTDEESIRTADAVVYDALSIFGFGTDYMSIPVHFPEKIPNQLWVNFGFEHHKMVLGLENPVYMKHIDANMTYDQKAEIPITFMCDWGKKNGLEALRKYPTAPKTKGIAFVASNCGYGGAHARTKYVKELMKYIPVDSYGACLHNTDWPQEMRAPVYEDHGKSMENKIKLFADYKFVLVFENNNFTDYVTEKLLCALQAGSIPVYMGAPNIDEFLPGTNSIIKTSDFSGPKELAEYLQALIHSEKYDEYLEWKAKPFSASFLKSWDRCVFTQASCRLCEHVYKKISQQGRVRLSGDETWGAIEMGDDRNPIVLPRRFFLFPFIIILFFFLSLYICG
eukprot:TRINITY_DN3451_c0_g1_i2.p1 TRINITY_DN3451_c0_g1~~TRINITY_DN3451_c0_g1_i2.p1  ORF type:complete len:422 (+),score=66.38 TRINITY_DN3451_c0_g1_i2:30-1268(+)